METIYGASVGIILAYRPVLGGGTSIHSLVYVS